MPLGLISAFQNDRLQIGNQSNQTNRTLSSLRHASLASSPVPSFTTRSASGSGSEGQHVMAAATGVDVETPSGQRLHFVWVPEVNSTQDGMRQLLAQQGNTALAAAAAAADVVALGAGAQTKGRGTSGRAWVGLQGNVFLTLALPTAPKGDDGGGGRPLFPFPITLLPLRIGTLVAKGTYACKRSIDVVLLSVDDHPAVP